MTKVDEATIVVGVDASDCSRSAVDWAADEARRSGRSLMLVNVWHWSSGAVASPMSLFGHDDPYTAGRHILAASAKRARRDGVEVRTVLLEGNPSGALTEASRGAAMLVLGHHGHHSVSRSVVGSVSRACLEKAHCPVVVVPAGLEGVEVGGVVVAAHHPAIG